MNPHDFILYTKTLPERKASYTQYPPELSDELCGYLKTHGIAKLYSHQTQMFEEARAGKNVVITTPTASGKTLGFLLPVLQEILKNPLARAIFLYPTKALAADQYRAILPYVEYFGDNRISAGVYDGDTPVHERSRIRRYANIILTNPEMLNGAFLPNHSKFGFDFIFSNLKFVVIDELHTYRGAFGSHLANVFRRFSRILRYYNASAQFLCSSATISNPAWLAENICGKEFVEINRDGSPAAGRTYHLVQPPRAAGGKEESYGRLPASLIAAELIPELVEKKNTFIAFAKSRRNVEVILKEARDKLEAESIFGVVLANKISGYRGGYTPSERRDIERRMIDGSLSGLISTNALELGIDIGKIDTTILVGYPGTRASFWQQSGRAGRSRDKCTNYMILDELPFDQYIAVRPEWLFETGSENAVIDRDNLLIELAHIRAAAAELPLTLDDIAVFPDLGETIPVLIRAKELTAYDGKFMWSGSSFPAGDYSLRNIDRSRYQLISRSTNQVITEMDEMQAFREIHAGAVYLHGGIQYLIEKLDLERKTAYAAPYNGNYYTQPAGQTDIRIIRGLKEREYGRMKLQFGDINVNETVHMFKKIQFHNHDNLGMEAIDPPLSKNFDTESAWLRIPENVVRTYRKLVKQDREGYLVRDNHFKGLCHAIHSAARMATMTEQEDIGAEMSSNAVQADSVQDSPVFLFLYDKYVGGLGYSEKIYDLIEDVLQAAADLVGGCTCKNGCAACIGDYRLDKKVVLWGLENLLEESKAPEGAGVPEYAPVPVIKKPFRFDTLPDCWTEFCEYIKKRGDGFVEFLSWIPGVDTTDKSLVLTVRKQFYKDWILQESNKRSLLNLISFYTDAPSGVELAIGVEEEPEREGADALREETKADRLERKYNSLKKDANGTEWS